MLQEILEDIQYSSHVWSRKIGRMQTPCVQQSKQSWQDDAPGMGRDIPCSVLSNYSLGAFVFRIKIRYLIRRKQKPAISEPHAWPRHLFRCEACGCPGFSRWSTRLQLTLATKYINRLLTLHRLSTVAYLRSKCPITYKDFTIIHCHQAANKVAS
jgi:hypothetical protein